MNTSTLSRNAKMQIALALGDRREMALRKFEECGDGKDDSYWAEVLEGLAEALAWWEGEKCSR